MNVQPPGPGSPNSLEPVENVFWHSSPSGDYKVHSYAKANSIIGALFRTLLAQKARQL